MKQNKLNGYILGLVFSQVLYISTAYAAVQTGICNYEKYPQRGGITLQWRIEYDENTLANKLEEDKVQVNIGGSSRGALSSFEYETDSVGTSGLISAMPSAITYTNFALTKVFNIVSSNPEEEVLQVPHKDPDHVSKVKVKDVVSLAIKKGQNPRDEEQQWQLIYKRSKLGVRITSHADLICRVSWKKAQQVNDGKEEVAD
ncbi:MAG: hypothetical protein K0R94_1281 [Burkholderiales bacterium]|jgi:hypothetical protein|nr:hypothetical protein [Burkholderiales bacterium]